MPKFFCSIKKQMNEFLSNVRHILMAIFADDIKWELNKLTYREVGVVSWYIVINHLYWAR